VSSATSAILDTVKKRSEAAIQRKRTTKQRARRSADDPGGLQALERDTATNNESARQLDETTEIQRDNAPSTWKRATALEAPPQRPGFVQRWVRIKSNGADDTENYDRYIEEGWRARKPLTVKRAHSLTTTRNQAHAQMIVKRGHVLMELTEAAANQRKKFYQGSLDRQTKALENELFADNTGAARRVMPLTDATVKSRAALARRRQRSPAADDAD
jgi:hypothetical protein